MTTVVTQPNASQTLSIPREKVAILSSMIKGVNKKTVKYGNCISVKSVLEKFENRICLLDTETTGVGNKDRIVEISVIGFDLTSMKMINKYSTLINPERKIPEEASNIHKIYDKDVIGKPLFKDIIPTLFPYLSNRLVVIHNAKFDMRMLLNEARREKTRLPSIHALCTLGLSSILFKGATLKLQDLHNRLIGQHTQTHSALDDTIMLGRLFRYYLSNFRDTVMDFNVEPNWVMNPPPKENSIFPKSVGI